MCCRGRLQEGISGRDEERAAEYATPFWKASWLWAVWAGKRPSHLECGGEGGGGDAAEEGGLLGELIQGRSDRGLDPPACFSEPAVGALADRDPPTAPRFCPSTSLLRTGWHCAVWDGKSEGCSRASPAAQNKHFLLSSPKAAKGLWPDNPPVFPGAFGALGWAGHFLVWEEALGGRAQL